MPFPTTSRVALLAALLAPAFALAQSEPLPVRAAPLGEIATPRSLRAPAEVVAGNDSLLASELALPIARVLVEVGQRVSAGDLLVQLDRRDPELQLRQALAQRAAAQARRELAVQRLSRGEDLAQRQFASADELLALKAAEAAAQADLEIADSAVALARRALDKTALRAPFDGEVVERMAQQGALATPGSPLVRLVQLGGEEVQAELPGELADSLAESTEVHFETPGLRLPLQLLRLTDSVRSGSRARIARLAFTDGSASPGRSGSLAWRSGTSSVPARLLVQREPGLGIFRVESGLARFTPLPGAVDGRSAEVSLPASTLVVVEGQQALRDGDPVQLAER